MGQNQQPGVADLHGLARVQRERRWIAIMDGLLAFSVVCWVAAVTLTDLVSPRLAWMLPVLVGVIGVHRVLVSVERQRRQRAGLSHGLDARRKTSTETRSDLSRAGG